MRIMLMLLGVCFSCNSYLDLKPYGGDNPEDSGGIFGLVA